MTGSLFTKNNTGILTKTYHLLLSLLLPAAVISVILPANRVHAQSLTRLPKLCITTENGTAPSCEIIYPPEEDMPGATITNNDYLSATISFIELPGGAVAEKKESSETPGNSPETAEGTAALDSLNEIVAGAAAMGISTDSAASQASAEPPAAPAADTTVVYDSLSAKIKVRGNSSAIGEKKSYKIKFSEPVELLNRGPGYADKEWLLLNSGDNLKTWLGFWLSKRLGMEYTPSICFVDVELNGRPMGIYMLSEPVKTGEKKVNIPDSGALFEDDVYWWNEDGNYIRTKNQPVFMAYTWKFPEDATPEDKSIKDLQSRLQKIENKLELGDVFIGKELDLDSMAKWLLVRDILGHGDPAGSNLYFYTDNIRSGKIKMGPLWDFDAAFDEAERWSLQHDAPYLPFYSLLQNKEFRKQYASKWAELAPTLEQELTQAMDALYASQGAAIEESRRANMNLWGNRSTLADEIKTSKEFFHRQLTWMNTEMGSF